MSVLETEIMNFEGNSWTVRDASTGLICFGMTGSGKVFRTITQYCNALSGTRLWRHCLLCETR